MGTILLLSRVLVSENSNLTRLFLCVICLLTDNGVIGFFFYLLPLLYCLHRFLINRKWYNLMLTLLFIVFNFTITGHLSGTGNFMYWLVVFELFNKAKYGCGKLDSPVLLKYHYPKLA